MKFVSRSRTLRGLSVIALLIPFASACQREPLPLGRTCEYLAKPVEYENVQLQLSGTVRRIRNGSYQFESQCDPKQRYRLVWANGVRWPEGIFDENDPNAFPPPPGVVWVTGSLRPTGNAQWTIEAIDYERQPFDL